MDTRLKEDRISTVAQLARAEDWSLDLGFEWDLHCVGWANNGIVFPFPNYQDWLCLLPKGQADPQLKG